MPFQPREKSPRLGVTLPVSQHPHQSHLPEMKDNHFEAPMSLFNISLKWYVLAVGPRTPSGADSKCCHIVPMTVKLHLEGNPVTCRGCYLLSAETPRISGAISGTLLGLPAPLASPSIMFHRQTRRGEWNGYGYRPSGESNGTHCSLSKMLHLQKMQLIQKMWPDYWLEILLV